MEHTPAPKKGGSYFSVQLKDVHQKKKIRFLQKNNSLFNKVYLIWIGMAKNYKMFECCLKWYFHNFGLMVRLICFARI